METVTIDKDIHEFLKAIYFGGFDNAYVASANRAYLDMNRTIRYNGMANEIRENVTSEDILRWEFRSWLKEARNK